KEMTDKWPGDKIMRMQSPQQPLPLWRYLVWLLVLFGFSYYWFNVSQGQQPQTLSYTEFKDKIRADKVAMVTLQGDQVSGSLQKIDKSEATGETNIPLHFVTTLPPVNDPELISLLEQHDVEVHAKSQQTSWWIQALIGIFPWILIIGLFWYTSRKMQERMGGAGGPGGIFGFGKSRAKHFRKGESEMNFDNVAGLENAKQDLREITGYLKDPDHYRKLGAKIPKGILLMGPPGTGKTLLAKAGRRDFLSLP
ncbi:MAG: ATP-dependent metallopeptidase FtsH/Yme1/Tma family protein, partial [Thermodesulfobacteriota bacterium]|nr:ATP-dependent metallopeptidase FtsH/Yme1/Tma family protein [Thermodesulfobacteriota bacterium]